MPTLYCRCAFAQVVPAAAKDAQLQRLCASGQPFEAVPDLCEMAARRDPKLAQLASAGHLEVIACHPRAVRGLFRQAGHPLPDDTTITNMREHTETG
jgi:hypothetical protein